jgi:hypothetical protein
MRITTRGLEKGFVYPCSKRDVFHHFGSDMLASAHFGLQPEFSYETRDTPQPELSGAVIALVSVDREARGTLLLYPIRIGIYSEEMRQTFREKFLPVMGVWAKHQIDRAQTQIFGYEKLIVECAGTKIQTHQFRFA